uniref:Uncharacterized protein n=1 Tax=Trieres chinensis TaxID=1514140 RepID=A0A7S1ZJ45_TRICV|mmetsp:Transcript_26482/g.54222  ORF Transcript_26482/g.54222 Transcript_26482/m.54222 type:complete len:127 (+) Transcript_26482:355-735(+)
MEAIAARAYGARYPTNPAPSKSPSGEEEFSTSAGSSSFGGEARREKDEDEGKRRRSGRTEPTVDAAAEETKVRRDSDGNASVVVSAIDTNRRRKGTGKRFITELTLADAGKQRSVIKEWVGRGGSG